ncbi:MAG: Sir2 family NAD-dependent protein deacetylase [Gammaproteobacteria bacterium]
MKIATFVKEIKKANTITLLTGAGISTASGIPDFRGENGFWKSNTPIYFDEFLASAEKRLESWKNNIALTKKLKSITFNKGHILVKQILELNPKNMLITQNIDGLHEKSGVPQNNIIEIHGTALKASCLRCEKFFGLDKFHKAFIAKNPIPNCDVCNGLIKVATISFGQPMNPLTMEKALVTTLESNLMIVLGSSLVVQPVADLPRIALENGSKLVICNLQPTPYDSCATLVINEDIENIAEEVLLNHELG